MSDEGFGSISRGLTDAIKDDLERQSSGGFGYFQLKKNRDAAVVRFLFADDKDKNLVVVREHGLGNRAKPPFSVTCIGMANGCPFCEAGSKPTWAAYFVLWNYNAEGAEGREPQSIQVWRRGVRDIQKVLGLISEYGALNERDFKIERQGTTQQNTQYQFYPRDKAPFQHGEAVNVQLPEIIENVLKRVEPLSIADLATLKAGGDINQSEGGSVGPVGNANGGGSPKPFDESDIPF